MADQKAKKPAAKSTAKPATKKRSAKPKATPKPTYSDLMKFKMKVDAQDDHVKYLRRRLRSANAEDTISIRNRNVVAVEAELEQALAERAALVEDYMDLKAKVYS